MNILSIDVGKTMGFAAIKDDMPMYWEEVKFVSLRKLYDEVKKWLTTVPMDIVLIPYPTRMYNVIVFQSKLSAVIELCAEDMGVPVVLMNDAHCKKVVLGDGHAKKPAIEAYYKEKCKEWIKPIIKSEHCRDAVMFCEAYFKEIELC